VQEPCREPRADSALRATSEALHRAAMPTATVTDAAQPKPTDTAPSAQAAGAHQTAGHQSAAAPSAAEPASKPSDASALQKLEPRLRAIPQERLTPPKVDAKLAALAALGVADRLAPQEVRARFARLPREEFDPAHLEDLRTAAWALWHAREALDAAVAQSTAQQLPAALVERGTGLKDRMVRVLSYYFAEELKKPLQQMQRRKGNAELPADLSRLAGLYRERKATLEGDKMHYRAGDADEADGIAAEAAQLAAARRGEAGARAGEQVARAFALLIEIYDEVRAAGLYLFRREAAGELFPQLTALSAPRGRPRKSAAVADASAEAPPSDPPPAALPKTAPETTAPNASAS
jgi:hypothetical protein